ncbi:MAG: hypothetical protein V7K70_04170 [Nostoc sp.]
MMKLTPIDVFLQHNLSPTLTQIDPVCGVGAVPMDSTISAQISPSPSVLNSSGNASTNVLSLSFF